jgi:hypothetical protein
MYYGYFADGELVRLGAVKISIKSNSEMLFDLVHTVEH